MISGPFYSKKIDIEDLMNFLNKIMIIYKVNLLLIKGPIISNSRKKKSETETYEYLQEKFFQMFSIFKDKNY